jgi:hypothetical protein
MDRRACLLLNRVAMVLVAALLGTPLWDHWYYRGLRTGPGDSSPVAVVVAAHAGAPRTAPVARPLAAPAAASGVDRSPRAVRPVAAPENPDPTRAAATVLIAPPSDPGGTPAGAPPAETRPAAAAPRRPAVMRTDDSVEAPGAIEAAEVVAGGVRGAPPAAISAIRPDSPPPREQAARPGPEPGSSAGGSSASRVQPPSPGAADQESGPPAVPVIRLKPDSRELLPDEVVVITVEIVDAPSISSLPFHLAFDPEVLEFLDSQVGPALAGSHEAILLASVHPNRPGDLAVGLSLVESAGLFAGSGALVHLRFRAVAPGESGLVFDRASLRGATSQPLNARFEETRIKVL